MSSAPQLVFWSCLALTFYTYVLYPVSIWLLARWFPRVSTAGETAVADLPEVSLLVAAYNEENVIERKILNSLNLDYPRDRLHIVIGSDGSSDATAEIVSRYADWGVRLLQYPWRRGKAAVLNSAITATGGEILVLSDANTEYEPGSLRKLVRWFADPEVNAVCGRLVLTDPAHGRNVDGLYWRYETFLKKCEGRLGALLGANGAIYALRRSVHVPIPNNTIVDDFVIPLLSKLRHGGRIVYDPAAVASEETPATIRGEFRRRVRIGTGAYQSLRLLWRLLSPGYGWTALAFFSHKLLRWLVPFFLLGMVVANLLLLNSTFYRVLLCGQLALYAVAVAGMYVRGTGLRAKLARAASMFVGMNAALLLGFCRWLATRQTGTWQKTARDVQPLETASLPEARAGA